MEKTSALGLLLRPADVSMKETNVIGRVSERKMLKSLLDAKEPQFVAVFGRRRIGKTYLVRESFDYEFTFQHTGVSNAHLGRSAQRQAQLDKFADSLADAGYVGNGHLSTWGEAFNALKTVIARSKDKKKVVFIDELSWMDAGGGDLIPALESFWNGWATARKEKDVILIVCASATYWMMDNIVNARGGLHNRLTGQIHLRPFTLRECEEYLLSKNIALSRHQILQCYMIFGGVPYYWSLLRRGRSLPQNVDELIFQDGAPLRNEFDNLYRALFEKPDQYLRIIEALSSSNGGITRDQICEKTGIASSGNLSRKLAELENCDFIRKYVPFGYAQKNALYQLVDNFTLFYYKFLSDGVRDEDYWKNRSGSPAVNAWSGIAFERVCLEHIPQIKRALGISGVYAEVNAWRCGADADKGIQGSQIDLLIARKDQVINLCEMKFSEYDFAIDAAFDRDMRRKVSDFRKKTQTRCAIHPTLITTYGLVENAYSGAVQAVITSEDLFAD